MGWKDQEEWIGALWLGRALWVLLPSSPFGNGKVTAPAQHSHDWRLGARCEWPSQNVKGQGIFHRLVLSSPHQVVAIETENLKTAS